jgi:iron-sulfur cluster repair protein YtfE (RIC family)
MGPKKSPSRKSKSKEPTPDPPSGLGDVDNTNNKGGGDDGKDEDAGGKVSSPKGGKKTVEMIQNEIAMLEKQAYDTKSKLLNESQFSELLGLQSEDEPEFIDEIIEMYTADARSMLDELKLCIEKNVKDAREGPNSLVELEKRVEILAEFLTKYMEKLKELAAAKNQS